jgi:hypothetical protein
LGEPVEIVFGLADVLGDSVGHIDAVEGQSQLLGEHLRRHGLAGAGWPDE